MKEELKKFIITYISERSIPAELWSAVVERVRASLHAVQNIDKYIPLFDYSKDDNFPDISIFSSLEDVEKEIDLSNKILARRISDKAIVDHIKGVLERRCE